MDRIDDLLSKLEERIDIYGVTTKSLITFLILSAGWESKLPEFVLHNFNALCGDDSWTMLSDTEKCRLYDYLRVHNLLDDARWTDFMTEWRAK